MTNRHFSYSQFSTPSQGVTSPDHFANNTLASPTITPQTSNGTYGTMDSIVVDAWSRYETMKRSDDAKNALIEEMIHRYSYISQEYAKLIDQVELDKRQTGTLFGTNAMYKLEYENLKRTMDRDPFVLVLIDGDGMVFHDHYLSKGQEGGRLAAQILRQSTELYAREQVPDLPHDVKIVTRMYANVKGLAEACCRAGLVESPETVEDFVRGFTRGSTLFDFVDVGSGKDRADEKVSELFKLHAYDPRCKHIVFGCSHDNGFARLLEKYIFDEIITTRVTLLEGQPFGKELLDLPFHRSKFGTIFRSDRLSSTMPMPSANGHHPPEVAAAAALLRSMSHTPSDSISSTCDSAYGKPGAISTWATRAAAAAVLPPPTPPVDKAVLEAQSSPLQQAATTATTVKDVIPRNRKGQRIDPIIKFDKSEVDRVRKMKMCNVHFLRNECPYGDRCTHKHDKEPSKKDLEVLKVVARFACCRTGSTCDDSRCIYGHRCQAPQRLDPTKWPLERGKTCIFGPECVFPAELHNIDTTPVKVTKV